MRVRYVNKFFLVRRLDRSLYPWDNKHTREPIIFVYQNFLNLGFLRGLQFWLHISIAQIIDPVIANMWQISITHIRYPVIANMWHNSIAHISYCVMTNMWHISIAPRVCTFVKHG